jgi:hypothetical protein
LLGQTIPDTVTTMVKRGQISSKYVGVFAG